MRIGARERLFLLPPCSTAPKPTPPALAAGKFILSTLCEFGAQPALDQSFVEDKATAGSSVTVRREAAIE
jgi:hypothetical protein